MKLFYILFLLLNVVTICNASSFDDYINKTDFNPDEKQLIRIEWENELDVDICSLYFQLKELEFKIKAQTKLSVGNFIGSLQTNDSYKEIGYSFSYKF